MNNIIKRVWNQNRMVNIEDLSGAAFQAESGGHTFEISGVDDTGAAVALSGTVAGVFRRPDNADIALTGEASDGKVYVTLTEDCYAVPGRFCLTIFVTADSKKTAVYAAIGTVSSTSGGAVAGDTPQDVVDLINAIAEAVATIPASYTNLMAAVAPTYSPSAVYPLGAYAWYNGVLYRCKTPIITAETWTSAHWTVASVGNDLSVANRTFGDEAITGGFNLVPYPMTSRTVGGVPVTPAGDDMLYIHGTASSSSGSVYAGSASELPMYIQPGQTYRVKYNGSLPIWIYSYDSGGTSTRIFASSDHSYNGQFTVPANAVGINFRFFATSGVTYDETVHAPVITTLYERGGMDSRISALETFQSVAAPELQALDNDSDLYDSLIRNLHNLVNYNYDTPYSREYNASGTWNTKTGIVRNKMLVTLNQSSPISSTSIYIRITGSVVIESGVTGGNIDAWDTGVSLTAGHKYKVGCKLISGTAVYDNKTPDLSMSVSVYPVGTHSTVGSLTYFDNECDRIFEAGNALYNFCLYLPMNKYTLTNAKYLVTLEDLSASELYQISEQVPVLPSYYASYMAGKLTTIDSVGLNIKQNGIKFCFITDYHRQNNALNSGALLRNICDKSGIKKVVFGGDAQQSETTAAAGYEAVLGMLHDFAPVSELADMFYITGNHEMNNPSGNPDYNDRMINESVIARTFFDQMHDVVSLEDENNCFYYDDTTAKIRVYFIGCDSKSVISIDSRRAILDSLQDDTPPAGYSVLLISHVGISYSNNQNVVEWRAQNIIDACVAMDGGTSATIDLTAGGEGTHIYKTVDFTGKQRTFIGMICGHNHRNAYVIYQSKYPVISTACDAYGVASESDPPSPAQTPRTVYEQCFDVVQIDIASKRIYMTRIGTGADRTFSFGENASLIS